MIINDAERKFYEAVAEILGSTDHQYQPFPFSKKTRWNNRTAGNGRYLGHGIVRRHGPDNICVQLYSPRLFATFRSDEDAINCIRNAIEAF